MSWDPELLAAISRALFGEVSASALAESLAVDERSIRRWLSGAAAPRDPAGVLRYFRMALESRTEVIAETIDKIEAALEEET